MFFFNCRKNHHEENEQTPGSRFEPRTLLLWCNSANHWGILLPLLYCRLIKDSWRQHTQKVGKGCRKFVMVMDVKHEITTSYISNLTLNIFTNKPQTSTLDMNCETAWNQRWVTVLIKISSLQSFKVLICISETDCFCWRICRKETQLYSRIWSIKSKQNRIWTQLSVMRDKGC